MVGFFTNSIIWVAIAAGVHYYTRKQYMFDVEVVPSEPVKIDEDPERFSCRPFLPKLFAESPPRADNPAIEAAVKDVDAFLNERFSQGDIDGISIAVVSAAGSIYEKNWGVQRGNESDTSPPMTSHSVHRISSVAKIFPVLQGLILEQKGIISWYVQPPLSPHLAYRRAF